MSNESSRKFEPPDVLAVGSRHRTDLSRQAGSRRCLDRCATARACNTFGPCKRESDGFAALVLVEWSLGSRKSGELARQGALFPPGAAIPPGPLKATQAAEPHRSVGWPKAREVDLAIAAYVGTLDARYWTQNLGDFTDVQGLSIAASR